MKSFFYFIRAIFRIVLALGILSLATASIVAVSWMPWRIRGVRPGGWLATGTSRALLAVFGVAHTCDAPEKIRQHKGLIFPNHLSFLDVLLLLAVWPVRFVGMAEVRSWPFLGWIAGALDTVFVDRSQKGSRQKAREEVAHRAGTFPAIVLFPEGHLSPDGRLLPFRYGAFEIAVQGGVPYLPALFAYDPLPVVGWTDESLVAVLWRMAIYPAPIQAHLHPMHLVVPRPDDDPKQLALEMHGAMTAVLRYSGREEELLTPEL